jgi:RNA polymerase-binding transcription factor
MTTLNLDHYKQLLLARETELSARIDREMSNARETDAAVHDSGDESVAEETTSEQFGEAEGDTATLDQVQEALARIDAGTYGLCVVDGEPIEPKRLEAMPWTPYCLKHQALLEADEPRASTL